MSTIKFELKKEHVELLKNLRWCNTKENILSGVADEGDELAPPFGGNDLYESIDLILIGKPSNLDPLNSDEWVQYTEEQKAEWKTLYDELPMALEIILYNSSFELGKYKALFHIRKWVKIK